MSFKPILFSTPMVRALLEGRKTHTRRIIKSRHESGLFRVGKKNDGTVSEITSLDWDERPKDDCTNDIHPKYKVGDVLWVRETWLQVPLTAFGKLFIYRSDFDRTVSGWKPSIHMPRRAARIFLEVTGVRVERLQDISEEDAIREGVRLRIGGVPPYESRYQSPDSPNLHHRAKAAFREIWSGLHIKENGWSDNPWVWVYEFKQVEKPENF